MNLNYNPWKIKFSSSSSSSSSLKSLSVALSLFLSLTQFLSSEFNSMLNGHGDSGQGNKPAGLIN